MSKNETPALLNELVNIEELEKKTAAGSASVGTFD